MAGISSVLNIAKEALLAHQLSVQVASHNIANVDTPGYTRQTLSLSPNQATPLSVGNIGNGVHGDMITRHYDQFTTQRIMNQNSTLGNLQAQQQSMQTIDTIFNEAPGLALNDLMSQFWESWQKLADNPEITATRQLVVQQANLLVDQLQHMNSEITQGRYDIGVNLDTAVGDVNSLTTEIAKLNVEITNTESDNRQANDLRDQRDGLVKELSAMLDITYFESSSGSYTVLLADGHSLVDTNQSWDVSWGNNQLNWLSTGKDGAKISTPLGSGMELGGKIGGWLEVRGQLQEGDPDNYLGRLDALGNAMIREVNQLHSQGVGLVPFSESFSGAETANNTAALTTVVDAGTAHLTIPAGTVEINGREIGRIDGVAAANGLAMGKTYNTATAINNAITGATAKMTTLVAGDTVDTTGLAAGDVITFQVNGIDVSHTVAAGEIGDPAAFASGVVADINSAIDAYNADPANPLDMTIEAAVGDTTNGGVDNSIVLYNTVDGDESNIKLENFTLNTVATPTLSDNIRVTEGTYTADETHNTGTLTLFSSAAMTIKAGTNDINLDQLGMGGAMSTTTYATSSVLPLGVGDVGSFSFSLNGQPVAVALAGPLNAEEVANQIVTTINTASGTTGVAALVGNGLNGGEQNSIVFRNLQDGDTSKITITGYTLTGTTDAIADTTEWTGISRTGSALTGDTANDGQLIYDPAEQGSITASLQGFHYADELELDNTSLGIWLYDSNGTAQQPQPVTVSLERAYDLYDVADAINSAISTSGASGWLTASVEQNRLRLTPDSSHQFAFTDDSTNFLQVAGINTFLTGYNAGTFGVNDLVADNLDNVAAGRVSDNGAIYTGDNSNAVLASNIQQREDITFTGGATSTLDDFYNALIADIGGEGRSINRNVEYASQVMNEMNQLRDETSGVSLDEEMANLIKFQHAYSAAAKLISASDEMLQTLLQSVGI